MDNYCHVLKNNSMINVQLKFLKKILKKMFLMNINIY